MLIKDKYHLGFLLILLISSVPIFYGLTKPAIYLWDEAIYANNALEMALHGDFWVLKNNGEVNLYNTKPPLVIWIQRVFISIFGPNELAIRLPSALATFFVCIFLYLFSWKTLGDKRIGLIAILTLVTTQGFIRTHVSRTGDLDAVLISWIVFYSLLAFHYLLHGPKNYKPYFAFIGLGILLAFFTKSVAAFLPLPGLFFAALAQRKLGGILKKPFLYGVMAAVLAFCAGYYVLRENLAAGYWQKVFSSEFMRLTHDVMPWHSHPFHYYIYNMTVNHHYTPYIYLVPVAVIFGFLQRKPIREFTAMCSVFCLAYLLLISIPIVKLNYYDAPLYPFLSLIVGVGMVGLFDGWWTVGGGRWTVDGRRWTTTK